MQGAAADKLHVEAAIIGLFLGLARPKQGSVTREHLLSNYTAPCQRGPKSKGPIWDGPVWDFAFYSI